jgi:hypothetical protein
MSETRKVTMHLWAEYKFHVNNSKAFTETHARTPRTKQRVVEILKTDNSR